MKKTALWSIAAFALLAACQPTGGQQADIKELREDVDALKVEVFGDPLASCEDDKIFSGIAPYADTCLLYTSPSPRDRTRSRMPSSA